METQEVPSEHHETLFHCDGGPALAQVAQRSVESLSLETLKSCLDNRITGQQDST